MVRWAGLIGIVAALGAFPAAAQTEEPPPYVASAPISAAPDGCRRVLVVGDSLARHAGFELQAQYDKKGYCARVINAAKNGSNAWMVDLEGQTWFDLLTTKLDKKRPHVVVMEFVGNTTVADLPTVEDSYLGLIDLVQSRGIPVFTTTPIVCGCADEVTPWLEAHDLYRTWQLNELPVLRPGLVGAQWSEVITPGDTYWEKLVWPDGPRRVRTFHDCVHLNQRGARIAAREWVITTQVAWTRPRPHPVTTGAVVPPPPVPGPGDRPLPGA